MDDQNTQNSHGTPLKTFCARDVSPNLDQWYDVDVAWKYGESNGGASLYVDDKLMCTVSEKNTAYLLDKHALESMVVKLGIARSTNCGPIILYTDNVSFLRQIQDQD